MCLLVLAWQSHPRYRLIVAANRDEFHERPSAPLAPWTDEPRIVAGRDLRGGGTWMGVARSGRFGIVTNFRDLERPPAAGAPSRGELVPQFLVSRSTPATWLGELQRRAAEYAGFNLLVGGARVLRYFSNRADRAAVALAPGIYGLSNHLLDTPWPKLVRTRIRFAELVAHESVEPADLFDLLADRRPADGAGHAGSGLPPELERALSAPFVRNGRYGTRCSSVLLAARDGQTTIYERRFDASGTMTGATRLALSATGTARDDHDEDDLDTDDTLAYLHEKFDTSLE